MESRRRRIWVKRIRRRIIVGEMCVGARA